MKRRQLFTSSMLWITVPLIILSILLVSVSRLVIKDYFEKDSYKILKDHIRYVEETYENAPNGDNPARPPMIDIVKSRIVPGGGLDTLRDSRTPRNTYIIEDENGKYMVLGPSSFVDQAMFNAIEGNDKWPIQGAITIENENVFYVITPFDLEKIRLKESTSEYVNVYNIAYISESYSIGLTRSVMTVFMVGLIVFILLTIGVLFLVFNKITRRLKSLEKGTEAIGHGEFNPDIGIEPYDEIGRLGEAMNRMGRQLEIIQEQQADHLQTISHELKTPIMVLQGYIDAMVHDQYPNGTKEASFKIIVDELNKLERMTKDLIALNKADYLSRNNVNMISLNLADLFYEVIERFEQDEIQITVEGQMILTGDKASWLRVVENIMTNQMRYAKSFIRVELGQDICISNDGKHIDNHLLDKIMKPFVKGSEGRSGLGLTIVNNTLKLYHYNLVIKNIQGGVEYRISKVR